VASRFLTDEQLAAYGRYGTDPMDRGVLERFFFLDDADLELIAKRRGDHNRLGFGLQLVTVRHVGAFLADPLVVPQAVVDYVAVQVGADDPSCVKRYTERAKTKLEHQWDISQVYGYVGFASSQQTLVAWLGDRAWTTGDGPKALFFAAVGWLRERRVLLPGISTLVELVAEVRQAAEDRLYDVLASAVSDEQARELEQVLEVPPGRRRSQLDQWRHGERSTSGKGLVAALDRVAAIAGLRMRAVDVSGVPTRRVIQLARYGREAKAPKLARHPHRRKIATLLATVRWLEVTATDDALDLFDVFMANELVGRAGKSADKQTLRRQPGYVRHTRVLAAAVEVLLEAEGWGEQVPLELVWAAIEKAVGSRAKVEAALAGVSEMRRTPPPTGSGGPRWWSGSPASGRS